MDRIRFIELLLSEACVYILSYPVDGFKKNFGKDKGPDYLSYLRYVHR